MVKKGVIIAIAVILILAVIVYTVVLFINYSQDSWIFAPYVPNLPANACEPLIAVVPLTDEELERQQELLSEGS